MRLLKNPDQDIPPLTMVPVTSLISPAAVASIDTPLGSRVVVLNMDRVSVLLQCY